MSGWIEIIIALLILGIITKYLNYIIAMFSIVPNQIMGLILFATALSLTLFVIHRKS